MCYLNSELPLFLSNVLNSTVDTRCKHPTYPSETHSSNIHRVWLCDVAVRNVTVVLVLQKSHNKLWIHSEFIIIIIIMFLKG